MYIDEPFVPHREDALPGLVDLSVHPRGQRLAVGVGEALEDRDLRE
jgi:hypothetical protein